MFRVHSREKRHRVEDSAVGYFLIEVVLLLPLAFALEEDWSYRYRRKKLAKPAEEAKCRRNGRLRLPACPIPAISL